MDQNNKTHIDWDNLLDTLEQETSGGKLLSPIEQELLQELRVIKAEASDVLKNYRDHQTDKHWEALKARLQPLATAPKKVKMKLWPRVAAAVLFVVAAGLYYYQFQENTSLINKEKYINDIAPGSNKATLILSDGKRVSLTDIQTGKIAEQTGVEISKGMAGQLIYRVSEKETSSSSQEIKYNMVETPRGGQYQILLPDGTKVWLNAASTLKYPSTFARLVNRRVELLSGEAYFEVAKDKAHPFIVSTDQQEVEVLGTHFNINAYADEPLVKTTLLEGSVKISNLLTHTSNQLLPGQQALLNNNGIEINTIDAAEVVLWKNGKFSFSSETMESIMRQIARWYDVEVVYKDPVQQIKVSGSVSRFANLSKFLEKLEQTGLVDFKIEGKKLIVMHP